MSLKKAKIGLVTYYQDNFGSILQCYATKKKIESLGLECNVICYISSKYLTLSFYIRIIRRIYDVIKSSIKNKSFFGISVGGKNESGLSKTTKRLMDVFVQKEICPKSYKRKELKRIGKSIEYAAFITGSDQIWNANNEKSFYYYLDFVRREKRVAYAASFGVDSFDDILMKHIRKGLSNFDEISVREESGKKLINKVSDIHVERVSDPTFLLDAKEWLLFCGDCGIKAQDYILVHFLNEPNDIAIHIISEMNKKYGFKAIGVGYYYDIYETLGWQYYDCGPKEYVAYINNATVVCTDSFHTTLFSVNLKKNFYAFERQYTHGFPQTSRIRDLLIRFDLEDRFVLQYSNFVFSDCNFHNQKISEERNKTREYLESHILEKVNQHKNERKGK